MVVTRKTLKATSRAALFLVFSGMIAFLSVSCRDVFDIHPYDVDFDGEEDINGKNMARIERLCANRDSIRFVVTGDTQGWYDETSDMVDDINGRGDIDFVIHGGDLSNYGVTREFVLQRDILQRLNVPYVALIGNHDCLGTGIEVFRRMYGDLNFSFVAGKVKFVCLNTNALEYDFSEAIPDFDFIQSQLDKGTEDYDKTVFCMHSPPFNEQFNNKVVHAFDHYVRLFPDVQFCTSGHLHRFNAEDYFNNGILYFTSDSANHRNYIVFTITNKGYYYDVVYY